MFQVVSVSEWQKVAPEQVAGISEIVGARAKIPPWAELAEPISGMLFATATARFLVQNGHALSVQTPGKLAGRADSGVVGLLEQTQ